MNRILQFNEREVLTQAGKLRADVAEKLALERYGSFDAARREVARRAAEPRRRWKRPSGSWKAKGRK